MTFKELQDSALDRLQYDSTLILGPRTRIRRYINDWNKRLLGDPRFSHLREGTTTFRTVPGQYQYAITSTMEKIRRIYDAETNHPALRLGNQTLIRRDPQAQLAQGIPAVYVPVGLRPIAQLPLPLGTGLFAASTDATDTTQQVRVAGVRQIQWGPLTATATLAGSLFVPLGTYMDWTDVTAFTLSAPCAGSVVLTDGPTAPPGRILGIIPYGATSITYYVFNLYPVPSTDIQYTVEGRRVIPNMVADTDQSLLTDSYDQVLALCAVYEELLTWKKETELAQELMRSHITPLLTAFLDSLANPADHVLVPETGHGPGRSNLGAWYPTGTW